MPFLSIPASLFLKPYGAAEPSDNKTIYGSVDAPLRVHRLLSAEREGEKQRTLAASIVIGEMI